MSRHMKRLAAQRVLRIPRKTHKWAVKPSPGAHSIEACMPLLYIVRDILGYADTGQEARQIIGAKSILVDGRPTRNYKLPVGFMDVITIPKTHEHFRVLIDKKGKLTLVRIKDDSFKWKLVKINNKTRVKGGKIQLNLHDGRNILLNQNMHKTSDVLKIEIPSQKILENYPFASDSIAYITGGAHVGTIATIDHEEILRSPKPNIVVFKENIKTIKNYVFVVGRTLPLVYPPEEVIE